MKAPLRLETDRLLLRQLEERDLDAHTALMADPEVIRFLGDGKPLDRAQSWRTMAGILGHWTLRGYGFWAMKPWAWAAGLAVYCASLGMAVFAVLLAGVSLISVSIQVGIAVAVIAYLMQPKVRSIFGR